MILSSFILFLVIFGPFWAKLGVCDVPKGVKILNFWFCAFCPCWIFIILCVFVTFYLLHSCNIVILGCPSKIKNFQKGTLGGSRFGQKGIKRGVQKRASSDFLAACARSEKRTSVAKRNPSRKPSMLLSLEDY